MRRYFETFAVLQEQKKVTLNSYCVKCGIDRRHWCSQRDDLTRGYFELWWIISLVENYHANPTYILLGYGKMFRTR